MPQGSWYYPSTVNDLCLGILGCILNAVFRAEVVPPHLGSRPSLTQISDPFKCVGIREWLGEEQEKAGLMGIVASVGGLEQPG